MTLSDLGYVPKNEAELEDILGPPEQRQAGDAEHDDAVLARPPTLSEQALYGPLGVWVKVIGPHTEASRAALLFTGLVGIGCLVGRSPYTTLDGARHGVNLFVLLVGRTSGGRKGTAEKRVRALLKDLDPDFEKLNLATGLSSGQGLIYNVRDERPAVGDKPGDPGVRDKRLLVTEAEFASALKQLGREGNTLSPNLREAWDAYQLRTLVKGDPLRASEPHISLLAQITPDELRRYLGDSSLWNGFANRFLFVWTDRSQLLPFASYPDSQRERSAIERLHQAIDRARKIGEITQFTADGRKWWGDQYKILATERPGRLGGATSRGAAQVRRIALLYAALDGADVLDLQHLTAADACWQYAAESAAYIFGDSALSPKVQALDHALRAAGADGLDRRAIRRQVFGTNSVPRREIDAVLCEVRDAGLAWVDVEKTNGRPREMWYHSTVEDT
jgi:uncharacterized protein DUF3987